MLISFISALQLILLKNLTDSKVEFEGILCESKKETVNTLIRFSSKIRCDTKPQEFREKQTNGLPSVPRSGSRETFLLND